MLKRTSDARIGAQLAGKIDQYLLYHQVTYSATKPTIIRR